MSGKLKCRCKAWASGTCLAAGSWFLTTRHEKQEGNEGTEKSGLLQVPFLQMLLPLFCLRELLVSACGLCLWVVPVLLRDFARILYPFRGKSVQLLRRHPSCAEALQQWQGLSERDTAGRNVGKSRGGFVCSTLPSRLAAETLRLGCIWSSCPKTCAVVISCSIFKFVPYSTACS